MKVTRDPEYSIEKKGKGSNAEYVVVYSIQVDGKEFKSEARSIGSESGAKSKSFDNLLRKISNNPEYEQEMQGIKSSQFQQKFGSEKQVRPEKIRFRSSAPGAAEPPTAESPSNSSGVNLNSINDLENLGPKQSTTVQEKQKEPKDISKVVHQRSKKQRNHTKWSKDAKGEVADGQGPWATLIEPVPEYLLRPGEKAISGPNNTIIVFGRDRAPTNQMNFSPNVDKRNYVSGYSNHMAAGSIDMVVGRMAPFPLSTLKGMGGKFKLAPIYQTIKAPPQLQGVKLEGGEHPGMMMDAARIYISQMTDVDENFGIQQNVRTDEVADIGAFEMFSQMFGGKKTKQKVVPTSAIMLKADKVRMHSRQDIKIVTGGQSEMYNSLGNRIKRNNGIHLIAENGRDKNNKELPQHPMVLGNNLIKVLEFYGLLIEDAVQCMDAMVNTQMAFNQVIASNFDLLPIPSATTVPNPFKQLAGIVTQLELLIKTRFGALFQLWNNFGGKSNYLKDSATNENYILSRYNTVN